MTAKRTDLTPLKFKPAAKSDSLERRALSAKRAGIDKLDDGQVDTLWRSLAPDVQNEYLKGVKPSAPPRQKKKKPTK